MDRFPAVPPRTGDPGRAAADVSWRTSAADGAARPVPAICAARSRSAVGARFAPVARKRCSAARRIPDAHRARSWVHPAPSPEWWTRRSTAAICPSGHGARDRATATGLTSNAKQSVADLCQGRPIGALRRALFREANQPVRTPGQRSYSLPQIEFFSGQNSPQGIVYTIQHVVQIVLVNARTSARGPGAFAAYLKEHGALLRTWYGQFTAAC